jgi:hypothetical protein
MKKIAAFICAMVIIPVMGWAQQTVILRDGTEFHGRIIGATNDSISFRSPDGDIRQFGMDRIDSIRFDHREGARQDFYQDQRGYNAPPPAGGPYSSYLTLPAGTAIAIRTDESIRTRDTQGGRKWAAQVAQDVRDPSGQLILPRGANAQLVVRRLGDNELALDLQSVSVNGQNYIVNTNDVVAGSAREGVGANKRTAEYAGGGALLGTLLGAVAGGGQGAAIGALAGGAAGAGTETLTRGSEVHVPAETVLSFRLDSPMTLMASR